MRNMSNTVGHNLLHQSLCCADFRDHQNRPSSKVSGSLYKTSPVRAALQLKKSLISTIFLENLNVKVKVQVSKRKQLMVPRAVVTTDPHSGLVSEVKYRLQRDYPSLPIGRNGRDDEEMIVWFLKDRKFDVEEAIMKLTKAIRWRQEFGVSDLTEESIKGIAKTGKAYVHDFLDVNNRPALVIDSSKHFPGKDDQKENERLCVFLIEKALSRLPDGKEEILGIFDLCRFTRENLDFEFLKFMFDVLYYYYPRRMGQILYVDAPFVFQPLWQVIKPMTRSYSSLVRFCNRDTVRTEYFTERTVPVEFRK